MKPLKIIALLLSAVIIIAPAAAALDNDRCNCGYDPMIYVDGFAESDLIFAAGTPEEKTVFFPDIDEITPVILKAVLPILRLCVTGDYDRFADSFAPVMQDFFEMLRCDDSGEPIYELTATEKRTGSSHSPNNRYEFHYDWRLDAKTLAGQLNDYIEEVKAVTGHDKVALRCVSMGGAVTMSYLYLYGHDSVSAVILTSSAAYGLTLADELYTGKARVNSGAVAGYIKNFIQGKNTGETALRCLITAFDAVGLFDAVSDLLNRFLTGYYDSLYEDILFDCVGNIPGPWCFLTDGAYEQAKEFMLDEKINAELIEKIDFYHYDVFPNIESLLQSAHDDGVKLGVISHYGLYGTPVVEDETVHSDFLVDTRHTSMGAVCAPLGETLGEDYTQQRYSEKNFLSADGVVDASTCLLPEYTWFVKGMIHTWFTGSYTQLVNRIAYADSQLTVFDDADYPQFLLYDDDTGDITPLTEQNSELYGNFEIGFNRVLSKLTAK